MYITTICMFFLMMILSTLIFNELSTILMMFLLIFYTLITSILMANLTAKTTYSFLMFLMIIGGLMILFMMFLSSISKEEKIKNFNINNFMIMIFMIQIMIYPMFSILDFQNFCELKLTTIKNSYYFMSMNKLVSYPNNIYTILLMILLLIVLFMITKLCLINNKPLRKFNN
uniref:NADH dehydrogenase subunit 6 n=1 Tax=Parapolybia varia TaxID=91407 RepID=A0A514CQJ6_9HYME|nr:NADH dehydrogenase subunit 6 [Parapolybia varia]